MVIDNVSLISPSRSTLKYLKWSYESIRNLYPDVEYCVFDDFSDDGTEAWCEEIAKTDKNFKYIANDGTWFGKNTGEPSRMGHTLGYDMLIEEAATRDFVMIWHSDMYALPGMLENLMKYAKSDRVISATRIEPPLHPDGPEKVLVDCGIEPEEFDLELALSENARLQEENKDKSTNGIFAPWIITRKDFLAINGHDPLYAPQSKEDSDIFNRFKLAGYQLIQARDSFCYHMTCRGSRFKGGAKRNPDGEVFMKDRETDEWLIQNMKSTRNFIRKWGTMVKHDALLHPIVSPKYNIGFNVKNCDMDLLKAIEPWCSVIHTDLPLQYIYEYIKEEQPNTLYDLSKRVFAYDLNTFTPTDILVAFDANDLNKDNINILSMLPDIIQDSGELGQFELDIFIVTINALTRYDNELIKVDKKTGLR